MTFYYQRFLPLVLFIALSGTGLKAAQVSDELKRNQILVTLLNQNTQNRHRVVKYLRRGDEQTPILISLPLNKKLRQFPILYVTLDGDPKSLSGLEFAHPGNQESNAIFVGLPSSSRIRDYTSPIPPDAPKPLDESTQSLAKTGPFKGDEFTRYLVQDILPFLEKEYGPFAIKILSGGSLGGIATLDVFTSYPQSFDAYAALSPSLWYNFDYYQNKMQALNAKNSAQLRNKCLLLTASEDEPSIFAATRQFDKLLQGLDLPTSFRYQFKRLLELQHVPSLRAALLLIPSFVFNASVIVPKTVLANLSFDEFQKTLQKAVANKTCFSHPNVGLLFPVYEAYGDTLAKEKRYGEAFELYQKIKTTDSEDTLAMLTPKSFIFSVFDKLSKEQKDALAKDYIKVYTESMAESPLYTIHQTNFQLAQYIYDNKIGPIPHSLEHKP